MSTTIYYFSGTGNSLIVARDIAEKTNGKLVPIPSLIEKERILIESDVIGIVFPVYHAIFHGIPLIIKRFVKKMDNLKSKYIFVVCTCQGFSRLTINKVSEIIKSRGGQLSAGFTIPMPNNKKPPKVEKQQKLFNNWKNKLEIIYQYINTRKKGRFENTIFYNLLLAPFASRLRNKTIKLLNNLANTNDCQLESLIPFTDRSFFVDETCNGCGICAKVCPVSDIKIINNKPVWQNRCESCLACINWCPNGAIKGSIKLNEKIPVRYHHPDVKLSDMFLRN